MSKKLTPWFPADVKPARVGVYEKDFDRTGPEYQFWDGYCWIYGEDTPEKTAIKAIKSDQALMPNARKWRGLAKKP